MTNETDRKEDLDRPAIDTAAEWGHDLRVGMAEILGVRPEALHPDVERRADA